MANFKKKKNTTMPGKNTNNLDESNLNLDFDMILKD
jgi:hypothetical protein